MKDHILFTIIGFRELPDFLAEIDSVDINILNEFGENLLHEAAVNRRLDCVIELLKRRINVDQVESGGKTSLHYAAVRNQFEIAERILAAGGRVDIADKSGNEVLWTAAFNAKGNYRLVKALIAAGANPRHKNNVDKSPLDLASDMKDQGLIDALSGR